MAQIAKIKKENFATKVLEVMNDEKIDYNYYIRKDNKWTIDDELTKENKDYEPDFFCNIQSKCLKINKKKLVYSNYFSYIYIVNE